MVETFPLEDVLFTGIFRKASKVLGIVKSVHGECKHFTTNKGKKLKNKVLKWKFC